MGNTIVNSDALAWEEISHGERYAFRRKQLALPAGGKMLGCSLYEVQPGKACWPLHYHLANEEAVFVLEGEGTLRMGERDYPLKPGDYVAMPLGKEHAHQIRNTSGGVLRYLCFSTMRQPDVSVYPETGKVGVFAGVAPGGDKTRYTLREFFFLQDGRQYWEGEE